MQHILLYEKTGALTVIHHFLLLDLVLVTFEQAAQRVADFVHNALASSLKPCELVCLLYESV